MQQPIFSAIDALEYPELHDESIPVLAFLRNIMKLQYAGGVFDFNIWDIFKPDPVSSRCCDVGPAESA